MTRRENLRLPALGVPYGERLVVNVVDEAAKRDSNRLIGMIPKSSDLSQGWTVISTKQLSDYVNNIAWWLEEKLGKSERIEPIAYIGANDFRYMIIELAAIKCGYSTLLVSTRNSTSNTVSILESTNCNRVFYTMDKATQITEIKAQNADLYLFPFPSMEEIEQSPPKPEYPYHKTWETAKDDVVIIVHTSGSTGNPKPVYYSHRFLALVDLDRMVPPHNGRTTGGLNVYGHSNTSSLVAAPMFHLGGVMNSLAPLWAGSTMVLTPTDMPPTPRVVLDIMKEIPIHTTALPITILEDLVSEYREEFLAVTKQLKTILIGGGPLAKQIGDWLSERYSIMNGIGSSETGLLHALAPEKKYWDYFEWHPTHVGHKMEPIGDDEGLHELVIYRDPKLSKFQGVFITQPGIDVWRTRDLFQKHPTKNMWKFSGRRDDVIVLSNGEKFNPVTMESIIQGHPKVLGAVVAGLQRRQCALLLEIRGKSSDDSDDSVLDEIWPTIEKANLESPGHAQITRNLVLVASPDKPFQRAAKGTIIRSLVLKDFEGEINHLYENSESSTSASLPAYRADEPIQDFIRQLVAYQLRDHQMPSDTSDLFHAGFDSLQATQLSSNLRTALRDKIGDKRKISPRLVYENPTIVKVSRALQLILDQEAMNVSGENSAPDANNQPNGHDATTEHVALINELVEKFSTTVSNGGDKKHPAQKERLTVLITGTTGSLGHFLVESLLSSPAVGQVKCFNRAGNAEQTYLKRAKKHQDPRLEFFKVSFGPPDFGLEKETLERLQQSVDVIIHNAWKVDFNQSLESFVDVHLQGVNSFISWCLKSRCNPSLYFVSSISSMTSYPTLHDSPIPEVVSDDCRSSSGNGYAGSKYVAERMIDAASKSGLRAFVYRVGQISGPVRTETDRWNDTEWFPSLVKTSKALGMLPSDLGHIGDVDWIPLDLLSDIMVEIINSTVNGDVESRAKVFNLVNPRRVQFSVLAQVIKDEYSIEIVPYRKWIEAVKKLEPSSENLNRYPALKLVEFFQANELKDGAANASKTWEIDNSKQASKTMSSLKPASSEDMKLWIRQWAY